jgi:glycosyltransferase involved in cell wall biosynthesis
MEIIHLVLGKANPERMNGVNKVVYELATRQAEAGLKVSVWGITADISRNFGQRAFSTRLFKACSNPFSSNEKLAAEVRKLKPGTVVHMHGGFIPVFSSISSLLHAAGIPFVFTPHGSYNTIAMLKSGWRKKLYMPLFEKPMLRKASLVHLLGQSEQQGLMKVLPAKKNALVPYGFEAPVSQSNHTQQRQASFTIAYCGRIDIHTKGLDALLHGFAQLHNMHADTRLELIGDGPERVKLEEMIRQLGLQNAVTLHGSKFGEEKLELLRAADVFAHPSRNEGLPSAVLEAASEGLPSVVTVATNVGDSVLQHNAGIVINDTDVSQVQEALTQLYELWKQDALLPMSNNARKMVAEVYNWKRILNEFTNMYKSVV